MVTFFSYCILYYFVLYWFSVKTWWVSEFAFPHQRSLICILMWCWSRWCNWYHAPLMLINRPTKYLWVCQNVWCHLAMPQFQTYSWGYNVPRQDTDVLHAVVSGDFSYKLCKNAHRDFTLAVVKHSECALQPDSLSCHDKIAWQNSWQ